MSDFSNYVESEIVSWMFKGEDMPVSHGDVYVALHTSDPTDSGEQNEVSAASYTRIQTATTDWTQTDNTFENASDVEYPQAQENWGTVSHFSLWDGPDDTDNALAQSSVAAAREIRSGDVAIFRQGTLTGAVD
jgi:hypothetical protein